MALHLRVFPALDEPCPTPPEPTVSVSLGDLLPLLALAQRRNYLWLNDFLDDEVLITEDLRDILSEFQRRPSA